MSEPMYLIYFAETQDYLHQSLLHYEKHECSRSSYTHLHALCPAFAAWFRTYGEALAYTAVLRRGVVVSLTEALAHFGSE
jgi:hypothetical protein